MHRFLRDVSVNGYQAALAVVAETAPDHLSFCLSIDVARLPACDPERYASEVAFAWDPESGDARELNRGIDDREYWTESPQNPRPAVPGQLAGRSDVVGVGPDRVFILDYKRTMRYLGQAAESVQLGAYALLATRTWDRPLADVAFARIGEDGEPNIWWATLDDMDLTALAHRIKALFERTRVLRADPPKVWSSPDLTKGPHCKYCPAFGRCPEQMGLVRAAMDEETFELNDDTAPAALEAYRAKELALSRVKERIDDFARGSPIRIAAGRYYGYPPKPSEGLEYEKSIAIIGQHFGAEFAERCISTRKDLSKESIKRAAEWVAQHSKNVKVTHLKREVLVRLRQGGAVLTKLSKTPREYKLTEEESDGD
jgi:hypothetical protein